MDNNNFNPNNNGNYYQNPNYNQQGNNRPQGMAIASMVCGIISICTCWCYGIVGLILAILALVFYGVHKKNNPGIHSGIATAGLVCGIIGLILSIIGVIYYAYILMNYDEIINSSSADGNSFLSNLKEFYNNAE